MVTELEQFKKLPTEQALKDPKRVAKLYKYFFGGEVCLSCQKLLKSYVVKLQNLHLEPMKKVEKKGNCAFELRAEIGSLQMDFGSSEFFNNDTLTDQTALNYLKINKNRIANFSRYPQNWEELLQEEKPTQKPKNKK